MIIWFKKWIARYDAWCQSMGLTPENKRSCVPYRSEPRSPSSDDKKAQS
ncbi:DUF5363 family protein [Vibrio galatheae]|nr:DUF5363 family protein [Vibrio galatheae]